MADPGWIAAGPVEALPPGARKLVLVAGGESIVVHHHAGKFFALENSCPHAGAALGSSTCEHYLIRCPAHGLRFDVRNGQCTASAALRIPTYAVVVEDGALWLCPPARR